MFNEMIVATVTAFSGTTDTDKNGKSPVMLQCIAGRMPNRNVLSGTVAERSGFVVGNTYLVQVRESGYDEEFGLDFNFLKLKELDGLEIIEAKLKLGQPEIFTVTRPEGFEDNYERKTNAVEGLRTKRIREGSYKPSYPRTSTDHETAKEVVNGSSTDNPDFLNQRSSEDLNADDKKARDRKEALDSNIGK